MQLVNQLLLFEFEPKVYQDVLYIRGTFLPVKLMLTWLGPTGTFRYDYHLRGLLIFKFIVSTNK